MKFDNGSIFLKALLKAKPYASACLVDITSDKQTKRIFSSIVNNFKVFFQGNNIGGLEHLKMIEQIHSEVYLKQQTIRPCSTIA